MELTTFPNLMLSTAEVERITRLNPLDLPLNARLLWELVRPILLNGSRPRVMEDSYFVCAETNLKEFLNEAQITPYYVQLREWLDGQPVSDESAISFRRMGCHRTAVTYVFEAPGKGCRIGYSINFDVDFLFRKVRRHYSDLINRLGVAGNKATTALIHAIFAAKKRPAESSWFDLAPDDVTRLQMLCAPERV